MGMYDHVNVSIPCPGCGRKLDWQSKDGDCVLETVDPKDLNYFNAWCYHCEKEYTYSRTGSPRRKRERSTPFTLDEVQKMGFKLC